MQNKTYSGILIKYVRDNNMIIWKIEESLAALNIYVDCKDEDKLTDLDSERKVYFKIKKVFMGREYGEDMNMNLAYNLSFEINVRAQKAEASKV